MTLKKKVLVGTLATSLAVTAFAGLPLSSKGLAEKLGVGVASAAKVTNGQQLQAKLDNVLAKLSTTQKAQVKADTKLIVDELKGKTETQKLEAIKPLTDKLEAKGLTFTKEEKLALLSLLYSNVADLDFVIKLSDYRDLLEEPDVASAIDKLEDALDVNITVEGLTDYALATIDGVNAAIKSYVKNKSDIVDLITNVERRNALLNAVENKLLANTNSEPVKALDAAVAKGFFSSRADAKATLQKVYNNVNGLLSDAAKKAKTDVAVTLGYAYYQSISSSGGIGGGGGGVVSSGTVAEFISSLSALKEKLATATAEEKQQLIAQALKDASAALAKVAAIDVSALVSVDGDKASVTITESSIASYVQAIKDVKQALVDAIGSSDGLVIPDVSFNLGTVAQSNVTVIASDAVLKQLADVGVARAAFVINGLTATFPVGGEFAKGIEFNVSKSAATAEQTKGLKAASDVYSFSLKLGGNVVEKFAQPVVIQFPVNAEGLDSELLSVARIESNGSLSFQGGDVNGSVIVEPRYSFSSYVVVENKVSFNDIASVQSWAGRQIEVVAAKGAIQGKAAGVFAPKDNITRAEFAKILVTALNLDNADATSDKFSDVKSTDWFAPYVAVAAEKGIINGRSATTFDPTATITRAELSTMIARALKTVKGIEDVKDVDVALAGFSDAGKIISSLKAGAALAASKNIVIGDGGKFRPNDNATRAEAAVIIYRAINVK